MALLRGNFGAFAEISRLLIRQQALIVALARREIGERYAGQALGLLWSIGHPIFMLGLYVVVFAFVFKVRLGESVDLPRDYSTYLLSGLIPWLGIQEALSKTTVAITANHQLVKQVVFPLEVLPVKGVLVALFTQLVATVFLIVYAALFGGGLAWTYLLLPVLFLIQLLTLLGLGFFLSAVGAYLRDIKDMVQLFAVAGIYLVPVFYLPEWVPPLFKPLLYANPLSYIIWCYQDALYFGRLEHPGAWIVAIFIAVLFFVLGYRTFRRLKVGFGNVL